MEGSADRPFCTGFQCRDRETCGRFEKDSSLIGWWISGRKGESKYGKCGEFEEILGSGRKEFEQQEMEL
ncbi:MAG: hypothetical protein GY804_02915 [Alphaproteobacteria bacterium]|nr:hypothetical protein [Alphaproteobacteria bacterium]